MEGSSLLGFFQLKVMVFPVMDSITGVPSGGSGSISGDDDSGIRNVSDPPLSETNVLVQVVGLHENHL